MPRILSHPASLAFPPHLSHLPAHPSIPLSLQLLVEVVQQLQRMFTPDVKVIKRAIDSLIDVRAAAFCCVCDLWGGSVLLVLVLAEQRCPQRSYPAGSQLPDSSSPPGNSTHPGSLFQPRCSATTWSAMLPTHSCISTWPERSCCATACATACGCAPVLAKACSCASALGMRPAAERH